jgi:hypothetical protein
LSVKDTMTLDFEQTRFKYAGAKEARVRELFAESMPRYSQRLNGLIDRPEALAYAPLTVNRLRRLREARQRQRGARRTGFAL